MGFLDGIGNFFGNVGKTIGGAVSGVVDFIKPALPAISGLVNTAVSAIPGVGPLISTGINVVSQIVSGSQNSNVPAAVTISGPSKPPIVTPPVISSPATVAAAGRWQNVYNTYTDKIRKF